MSGRNTCIARSRLGEVRFPPRPAEPPTEVNVYYMPMEDVIKKYGPPSPRRDRDLSRGQVAFAVGRAGSLKEAAMMIRVSEARMKKEMARHCIATPKEWKEAERVQIVNENGSGQTEERAVPNKFQPVEKTVAVDELAVNVDDNGNSAGQDKADRKIPDKLTRDWLAEELKVRSAEDIQQDFPSNISVRGFAIKWGLLARPRVEELLPRDTLLEYKGQGMTDREIMKKTGITNGEFYKLKEQYGLTNRCARANKPKEETPVKTAEEIQEAPGADDRYTVARLVELREHLIEDIDGLRRIRLLVDGEGHSVSERIIDFLDRYSERNKLLLELIDKAFCNTEIAIGGIDS